MASQPSGLAFVLSQQSQAQSWAWLPPPLAPTPTPQLPGPIPAHALQIHHLSPGLLSTDPC